MSLKKGQGTYKSQSMISTLPETNSLHLAGGRAPKRNSSSNPSVSGAFAVSFRDCTPGEFNPFLNQPRQLKSPIFSWGNFMKIHGFQCNDSFVYWKVYVTWTHSMKQNLLQLLCFPTKDVIPPKFTLPETDRKPFPNTLEDDFSFWYVIDPCRVVKFSLLVSQISIPTVPLPCATVKTSTSACGGASETLRRAPHSSFG